MDLMRRVAAGELSELVGPAALEVDINHRRHRLRAVVEAAYAQLPPEQKHELDLYRDGVNAGLANLREKTVGIPAARQQAATMALGRQRPGDRCDVSGPQR